MIIYLFFPYLTNLFPVPIELTFSTFFEIMNSMLDIKIDFSYS